MKKPHSVKLFEEMVHLIDMGSEGIPAFSYRDWISRVCIYLGEVDKKLEEIQFMDELAIEHFDRDKHEWKFQRLAREARKL